MYGRTHRIHFVGVGGVGMCGIAEVLLNLGYQVSGSDLRAGEATDRLAGLGRIFQGHEAANVEGAQVVVYSTAVKPDNPEVVAARAQGHPGHPRADMLAELMRMKYGVAVAGSHGKTTTTSLVAAVLARGGLDPTIVVGGRLQSTGSNARLGHGQFLVAEADESDGSFLRLSPAVAVITNIDREHLDHYGSLEELRQAFIYFANRVPFYGVSILCADDPQVRGILPQVTKRHLLYGTAPDAALRAEDVRLDARGASFRVVSDGRELGTVSLALPGLHNVLNALAAVAVGLEIEVAFSHIADALGSFRGVGRRFETRGEENGVKVVDDYGHHPTEIAATLAAARTLGRRVLVLFQPHRYTRTALLHREFGACFGDADKVWVLDIYPAGESPVPGVTARTIVQSAEALGQKQLVHVGDAAAAIEAVAREARPGDLVLTLGAGDVGKLGDRLLARLRGARGELMALYQGRALERGPRPDVRPGGRSGARSVPNRRWNGRPRVLRSVRVGLALVGIAGLALAATRVPWRQLRERFAVVQEVRVEGALYLDAARVGEIAGLRVGDDLIALDPERARQALLLDPRISRAEVRRGWLRDVRVRIVEREPVLVVTHGTPWEVDSAGVLLQPLARGLTADVPLLTGPDFSRQRAGTQVLTLEVRRGLAWVRALAARELQLAVGVSEVDVSDPLATSVLLENGTRVLAPTWPPGARALSALRVVLSDLQRRGVLAGEVDLRFEDQVVVRPAGAPESAPGPSLDAMGSGAAGAGPDGDHRSG